MARWHMQTIYQIHPQRVFHIDHRKRDPVCEKNEWSFFPDAGRSAIEMSDGSACKVRRLTATCVVTVLSCTAAFISVLIAEPGHRPLPGTRTAVELLAKGFQRDVSKLARFHIALESQSL